jgi:hypothetical protein
MKYLWRIGTTLALVVTSLTANAMVPCVCPPIVSYHVHPHYEPIPYRDHTIPYLHSLPTVISSSDACPPASNVMVAPLLTTPPMVMQSATQSDTTLEPKPETKPTNNESPTESAKPIPAIPDAPTATPKSEEPPRRPTAPEPTPDTKKPTEPKSNPTPITPPPSSIPKLTLPTKGNEQPKAPPKAEPPKVDLPPFNFEPTTPKSEPKKPPELVIPALGELKLDGAKTSESKYTPSETPSVRVVPTEGDKPSDKARLAIFNYMDRDITLTIAGESYTITAKSSLVLAVADGTEWQLATRKATLNLPSDASGWQMILQK